MTYKQQLGDCECCGLGGYCVLLLVFIVLVISSFGRYYVLQIIADHLFLDLDIPPIAPSSVAITPAILISGLRLPLQIACPLI